MICGNIKLMNQAIQQIVNELVEHYRPEKIILFGSNVSGQTHKWSDVDIVAIKKTDKNFYDRIGEVSSLISHETPIDILVYTPEEFERMARENYFIKNEVITKGKVLYEQGS